MMWGVGWSGTSPDGGYFLELMYGPNKGQANHARFELPAFNKLYEQQRGMPDGPERFAVMADAARLMVAYMPYKASGHDIQTWVMQPRVQGYMPHPFMRDFVIEHRIDGMEDGQCAYRQSMPGDMHMDCKLGEAGRAGLAAEFREFAAGRMSGGTGEQHGAVEIPVHQLRLRRLLGRACAAQTDEVFQDTWLRVVQARARWQPLGASFRTWLFTLALLLLIAEAAKSGRTYTPDPNTYAGYFFRSDHFSLAQRGVPLLRPSWRYHSRSPPNGYAGISPASCTAAGRWHGPHSPPVDTLRPERIPTSTAPRSRRRGSSRTTCS